MRPLTPARDIVLLLARILLGVVLMAHGWQKFVLNGLETTGATFEKLGVPLPGVSAALSAAVELGGGALLILGAFTPVAGLLVAAVMAGAFMFVHAGNGVFMADNGWELVAGLGLAAVTFAVVGPGRFSVDHALSARRGHDVRRPDATDSRRSVASGDRTVSR